MLPGMELMGCQDLAVPGPLMHQVVRVESSFNPYAIGVVGARLARQPKTLPEAVATARMLESRGYNFSVGLAQVNYRNLRAYGLQDYERAFDACPNLRAGARILAECHGRSRNDWGRALSCYYSGNFITGFQHGYVQKVLGPAGMAPPTRESNPIPVVADARHFGQVTRPARQARRADGRVARRTGIHPDGIQAFADHATRASVRTGSGKQDADPSATPETAVALPAAPATAQAAPMERDHAFVF